MAMSELGFRKVKSKIYKILRNVLTFSLDDNFITLCCLFRWNMYKWTHLYVNSIRKKRIQSIIIHSIRYSRGLVWTLNYHALTVTSLFGSQQLRWSNIIFNTIRYVWNPVQDTADSHNWQNIYKLIQIDIKRAKGFRMALASMVNLLAMFLWTTYYLLDYYGGKQ